MLSNLLTTAAASPIKAVGNILDKLFTSDEERLDKQLLLQRLLQEPNIAQIELNKVEAQHRSLFVAGWRPFIGWVCGLGLMYEFLVQPILTSLGYTMASVNIGALYPLVMALLGLGTMRTAEKFGGRAK